MFDLTLKVLENINLTGKYYRLRIEASQIASTARTGQFCMLRPERSGESILRRPFSIAAIRDNSILEFAYTAIGRGTRLLAALKPGDPIWCLGPLGNSFPIIEGCRAMVVAGGIGIAPFPFLNDIFAGPRIWIKEQRSYRPKRSHVRGVPGSYLPKLTVLTKKSMRSVRTTTMVVVAKTNARACAERGVVLFRLETWGAGV